MFCFLIKKKKVFDLIFWEKKNKDVKRGDTLPYLLQKEAPEMITLMGRTDNMDNRTVFSFGDKKK